jgi:hypothetical protein
MSLDKRPPGLGWIIAFLIIIALFVLCLPTHSRAQTSPGFVPGQTLTATQLNNAFASKTDTTNALLLGALQSANNLSDVANPATARTNLGAAGSGTNSDIVALTGLTTPITIPQGGSGATTAAAARSNFGLTSAATTAIGTSGATIPLLNGTNTWANPQTFSAAPVFSVAPTFTDQSGSRTALLAAKSGTNSDITSLTGLSTPLSIAQGGTASTSASAARTALAAAGLGANNFSTTQIMSQEQRDGRSLQRGVAGVPDVHHGVQQRRHLRLPGRRGEQHGARALSMLGRHADEPAPDRPRGIADARGLRRRRASVECERRDHIIADGGRSHCLERIGADADELRHEPDVHRLAER